MEKEDAWCFIVQEKTDLEEQRHALAREVQAYRSKIVQLEEDLLFRLSNSKVICLPFDCLWASLFLTIGQAP